MLQAQRMLNVLYLYDFRLGAALCYTHRSNKGEIVTVPVS